MTQEMEIRRIQSNNFLNEVKDIGAALNNEENCFGIQFKEKSQNPGSIRSNGKFRPKYQF
jgi:hypothetical protein